MAVASQSAGGYPDAVGSAPLASRRHPLLEKHSFEQLQRNEVVETRPHILHFGGFQIHKEHSQVLRVLNISLTSMRVVILAPSTQYFQISYDKKGLLAPGMSEDITVTFTPHEWRYYYDTVKIFVGDSAENLVVPIHAYPSANDIVLPRIVDFGKVAIGSSKSKVIPLSCKIPIQFEFEITIVEADSDFEVSPLSGVIPADGSIEVGITFMPKRHRTSRLELKFNIAQFDFEPVMVSVTGSSVPDLQKEELLRQHELSTSLIGRQQVQEDMLAKMSTLKAKRPGRKPLDTKMPIHVADQGDRYRDHIGGAVKIPPTMDQPATNFVLNQTAGKRPLKDLMAFINEQRQSMENRKKKAAASAQLASTRSAIDEDEEDDDDRQAMELRFEMTFREIEKYDKDKELKSVIAIGEDLLTESEISRVQDNRQKRQDALTTQRIGSDLVRVASERSQEAVAVPNSFRPAVAPHWDENRNDMFSVRLQVIDRFVRAGSKSLMRVRAQKNYEKLLEALKAAGVSDRESCKSWVDAENKAAAAGGRSSSDVEVDAIADDDTTKVTTHFEFALGFVLPVQIPTAQSLMSKEDAQEVEVLPLDNFEEFRPVAIQPRLDYKVYEYEKYVAPPPAAYMRPCGDRPRLKAALEELSVRGICGDVFDGAEEPIEMPASCLLTPQHDPMSLLVPSTECRTFVRYPDFTECDFEYRLAKEVPLIDPLKTEPLLPPDLKSLEYPWLSTWRPLRRLPDPFEHFDPLPCSFVEAGGRLGPKLGGDLCGERLSFLPVGGHARDLPSDTDSDEREDFQMPVPGEELFDEAMQRMKGPLPVSEQWHKERLAEERLEAQCDVSGKVVRSRLKELNKDLDTRNKLFLG